MIFKSCIYHLVQFKVLYVETSTFESVPVVNAFPKVFSNDLYDIPPKREIDFGIDLLSNIHPISIPPYQMSLAELKELKDRLKDLCNEGFIRPSMSLWGALVLFVQKKDGSFHMCIDTNN